MFLTILAIGIIVGILKANSADDRYQKHLKKIRETDYASKLP